MQVRRRGHGWTRRARRAIALAALTTAALVPVQTQAEASDLLCIPYAGSADPGPQCALDIWGYVMNASGQPVPNARVYDGNTLWVTDETGFYLLPERSPSSYRVWAGVRGTDSNGSSYWMCEQTAYVVDPNATTLTYGGGARQDFSMPCG